LEGKLSPTVKREIERHLSNCPDCRLVLDAATTTLDQYFAITGAAEGEASTKAA
jgi:predicted anti-sigma-YlaC factor YlaD